MLDGNVASDGGAVRRGPSSSASIFGCRGLMTASLSSASAGGDASSAMLTDWDPRVGHCGMVIGVCCECARYYRIRGVGWGER